MAKIAARDTYGRVGLPRIYGVIVGVCFVLLAIIEMLEGHRGHRLAGHTILMYARTLNIIHWGMGVVALGAALVGPVPVKIAIRTIGFVLAALTILGLVARRSTGTFLGFHTRIPMAYDMLSLIGAVVLLFIGFSASRQYYVPD